MCFSTPEDGRLSLWPERRIETDQAKARRVYQSLDKKLGAEGKRLVVQGFLTCLEEKELHLWRFLRLGYQLGPGFTRGLADERVAAVWKAVRSLRARGFAVSGGVAAAVQNVVKELRPDVEMKIVKAEGLRECRKMMALAKAGKYNGYLLEGMACPGGCVAGAGTITPVRESTMNVEKFKKEAVEVSSTASPFVDRLQEVEER